MTWISRFTVDPIKEKLWDCYDWHQFVWKFFPDRSPNDRPFVFRYDMIHKKASVAIISRVAPHEVQNVESSVAGWSSGMIPDSFFGHSHYRFSLRANATERDEKRDRYKGRDRKRRRFVITDFHRQRAWFARQGERYGFSIQDDPRIPFHVGGRQDFRFRAVERKGLFVATPFQGILAVTDAGAFRQAIEQGIGRGRSFGFGLLMVQPVTL